MKETLDTSSKKVSELNKEFDLVGKAKQLTSAAADLSDKAIDAVDEANTKYDFVKVAKETANKAINAAKEQSKQWTFLLPSFIISFYALEIAQCEYCIWDMCLFF